MDSQREAMVSANLEDDMKQGLKERNAIRKIAAYLQIVILKKKKSLSTERSSQKFQTISCFLTLQV